MNNQFPTAWREAIQAELAKIKGRGAVKKQATVIALIEAHLTGASIDGLWGKNGLPHRQTYYSTDPNTKGHKRGWKYDPTFSAVLTAATQIADEWQAQKRVEEFEERMVEWGDQIESTFTASLKMAEAMLDKANKMLQFPLQEVEMKSDIKGKPVTVISPAKWNMDTVAKFAKTAVDLANAAQTLMDLKLNGTQPLVQINNINNQQNNVQHNTAVVLPAELKNADEDELNSFIHNLLYLTDGNQ